MKTLYFDFLLDINPDTRPPVGTFRMIYTRSYDRFEVRVGTKVNLKIYTIRGRFVTTMYNVYCNQVITKVIIIMYK